MSEIAPTINEAQGEELQELSDFSDGYVEIEGKRYEYYSEEYHVEEHRWATTNLYVFKREDGMLFGMYYDIGSTESQESGFIYNTPRLFEVEEIEVITRSFKEVK